ncbi:MAG: hypothetical protein JXB13_18140 [Phycisphaerae bacterium]|nr:hypothetical protein [Phycisphaerae bacterium]
MQKGQPITFVATTTETDPVVQVTFSYEGTTLTDVDDTPPYQVTRAMAWTTLLDLTVTATFEFQTIDPQQGSTDVDVVDITLNGLLQMGRGAVAGYSARTSPTGLSVSRWDWQYDTVPADVQMADTNGSDDRSSWAGRMVVSGDLSVAAEIEGIVCEVSKSVTVKPRQGTGWNTPANAVQDNEPYWGASVVTIAIPILGELRDRESDVTAFIVPQSGRDWSGGTTRAEVTSGPCNGLWYVASESFTVDQETVVNRFIKSGGPPPDENATNFFDHNNAAGGCIAGNMSNFVQAVMNHEYRGTPEACGSLEGHFGRVENYLAGHPSPGQAVEGLVSTSQAGLVSLVNAAIADIEDDIAAFTAHGDWNENGPNWGGPGSLGSGKHTRYNPDADDYVSGCPYGPEFF